MFTLTGEKLPPDEIQAITGEWLLFSVFTFGLGAATGSSVVSKYETRAPTDDDYKRTTPKLQELVKMLQDGNGMGEMILPGGPTETTVWITAKSSERTLLEGFRMCDIMLEYQLALPSMRPGFQDEINRIFAGEVRDVHKLPTKERTYSLSNAHGYWKAKF